MSFFAAPSLRRPAVIHLQLRKARILSPTRILCFALLAGRAAGAAEPVGVAEPVGAAEPVETAASTSGVQDSDAAQEKNEEPARAEKESEAPGGRLSEVDPKSAEPPPVLDVGPQPKRSDELTPSESGGASTASTEQGDAAWADAADSDEDAAKQDDFILMISGRYLEPLGNYQDVGGKWGLGFGLAGYGRILKSPFFVGGSFTYDVHGKEDYYVPLNGSYRYLSSTAMQFAAGIRFEPFDFILSPFLSVEGGGWRSGYRIKEEQLDPSLDDDFTYQRVTGLGLFSLGLRIKTKGSVRPTFIIQYAQGGRAPLYTGDALQDPNPTPADRTRMAPKQLAFVFAFSS